MKSFAELYKKIELNSKYPRFPLVAFKPGETSFRFLPETDSRFFYEQKVDRPGCECHACAMRAARGQHPREVTYLNVLGDDNAVKMLRITELGMRTIRELYKKIAERDRLVQSYKDAARRFKMNKMFYRSK